MFSPNGVGALHVGTPCAIAGPELPQPALASLHLSCVRLLSYSLLCRIPAPLPPPQAHRKAFLAAIPAAASLTSAGPGQRAPAVPEGLRFFLPAIAQVCSGCSSAARLARMTVRSSAGLAHCWGTRNDRFASPLRLLRSVTHLGPWVRGRCWRRGWQPCC